MFTPKLFIGIGATGALFTLRETYLHEAYIGGQVHREVRSFHHYNLSQDADEALAKAKVAAEQMALPLDAHADTMAAEMREITRATAEQLERRAKERRELEQSWADERAAREAMRFESIAIGRYPFGRFEGKEFREAPVGYINWLADSVGEFEEGSVLKALAIAVAESCADLILPKPDKAKLVGAEKQRLTFNVTIVRDVEFARMAYGGWGMELCHVVTMVTDDGACLVSIGTSFRGQVGEKLTIKATVKKHDEYKGQAQTVVQRVAVID